MATAYRAAWEGSLVRLANQAWRSAAPHTPATVPDPTLLAQAYAHCDRLIAARGKTFYLATRLLPAPKRRAIRTLYAFCRVTDDIVDCPQHDPKLEMARWRQHV